MSVLLIGESLINKITTPDGSTRLVPGGSMLNVAIGLRHLGRTARLVTDFGLDPNGQILAEYAASNGLELWLRADSERTNPTSVSHVSLDASEAPAIPSTSRGTFRTSPSQARANSILTCLIRSP